jgi:hypothetical protein
VTRVEALPTSTEARLLRGRERPGRAGNPKNKASPLECLAAGFVPCGHILTWCCVVLSFDYQQSRSLRVGSRALAVCGTKSRHLPLEVRTDENMLVRW